MRRSRLILLMVLVVAAVAPTPARAAVDPSAQWQWNLTHVKAGPAWEVTRGAGVRIGIVDTGVDLLHEDLQHRIVAHSNCIGSGGEQARCTGSGQDDNGHGTHVAGIAVAERGNGRGVIGVAPEAELVVAKVLNSAGEGTREDVVAGVKWAVDQGARVVNLSLGDSGTVITSAGSLAGSPNSLQDAIDYAWSRGAVPVIAAGNHNALGLGLEAPWYTDVNAVMVGATGEDGRIARYSGATGTAKWALLAPGGSDDVHVTHNVLSTFWLPGYSNVYAYAAGTSMATPHVSGAVALLLAVGESPRGAVTRILRTTNQAIRCGSNSPTCQGLLNLGAALDRTAPAPH